jgi:hypothetical protein
MAIRENDPPSPMFGVLVIFVTTKQIDLGTKVQSIEVLELFGTVQLVSCGQSALSKGPPMAVLSVRLKLLPKSYKDKVG